MSMNFSKEMYSSQPKDVPSLDDDLALSRQAKYEKLAVIVKPWIYSQLEVPQEEGGLIDLLQDGTILCELVNKIETKYNGGRNTIKKYKKSSIAFVQMENISFFLNYCTNLGVPQDELFLTVDLYQQKDPYQVLLTIQSFSRSLNKTFPEIPIIGPKIATKPPVPSKPRHLKNQVYTSENPNWSTTEYGYVNKKTETIAFDGARRI